MHAVYVACLVGGAVATALFALLGWAGGAAHGGHAHVAHGHGGHVHTHAHAPARAGSGPAAHAAGGQGSYLRWLSGAAGWGASWLSPLTISAAALWFGGIGLLAEGSVLALLFAIVAALMGATLIRYLMSALVRASTPPLSLGAEGALATVNATIRPDATGEVIYTLEGLHRSLPARSEIGGVIPRGTAVVITRREGGFAWVEPLEPLERMETEESADAAR